MSETIGNVAPDPVAPGSVLEPTMHGQVQGNAAPINNEIPISEHSGVAQNEPGPQQTLGQRLKDLLGDAEFVRDLRKFNTPQALREFRNSGVLDVATNQLRDLRGALERSGLEEENQSRFSNFISAVEKDLDRFRHDVP